MPAADPESKFKMEMLKEKKKVVQIIRSDFWNNFPVARGEAAAFFQDGDTAAFKKIIREVLASLLSVPRFLQLHLLC